MDYRELITFSSIIGFATVCVLAAIALSLPWSRAGLFQCLLSCLCVHEKYQCAGISTYMALLNFTPAVNLNSCSLNKTFLSPLRIQWRPMQSRGAGVKPLVVETKMRKRANSRTESAKIRNRRLRKKYNGTRTQPRLSVFCSDKQLYAMLVDDENKKCLFYGSTSQKSIRSDPNMSTAEAAKVVGEELVKAAISLNITEISSYDRNGFSRGERMEAFETAISEHGFLPR